MRERERQREMVGWLDLFKVVQQTGISASLYEDDFWQ